MYYCWEKNNSFFYLWIGVVKKIICMIDKELIEENNIRWIISINGNREEFFYEANNNDATCHDPNPGVMTGARERKLLYPEPVASLKNKTSSATHP